MKVTQQLIAEFVGTLALVFIGAGSVVVLAPLMGTAAVLLQLGAAAVVAMASGEVENVEHVAD